jgi:hypothetical protein
LVSEAVATAVVSVVAAVAKKGERNTSPLTSVRPVTRAKTDLDETFESIDMGFVFNVF